MEQSKYREKFIEQLKERRDNHSLGFQLKASVQNFVDNLMGLLFPHFCLEGLFTSEEITSRLVFVERDMKHLLSQFLHEKNLDSNTIAQNFLNLLPTIYEKLWQDAEAINSGDPASENVDEVILAYPGFMAIAIYRFAPEFYLMKVPIFPRLLTEYAHQITGIDINPGAEIGRSFAIDHGTGIVIGETAVIGNNVKIYQGVTLGALSVDKGLAKSKRHPTIEDNVVIYAQAVILGGETVVGQHSIIGGNVWLTTSVPSYSIVYQESKTGVRQKDYTGSVLDFSI